MALLVAYLYERTGLKPFLWTMRESLFCRTIKAHEASFRLTYENAKFMREEDRNERRTTGDGRA